MKRKVMKYFDKNLYLFNIFRKYEKNSFKKISQNSVRKNKVTNSIFNEKILSSS